MERTNPGKRIEAKIEKENRTITIKATTDATEGTIKLMVDTGSQISLIAKERIKQGAKITQKGYIISGIAGKDHAIRTEGTIQAKITINETELEEEFIIMEEKYLRPYDGYLGCEFLNRMKGSINLEDDKNNIETRRKNNTARRKNETNARADRQHKRGGRGRATNPKRQAGGVRKIRTQH